MATTDEAKSAARAFCRAFGLPWLLDQSQDDDRRAVDAMVRVQGPVEVACYLGGLRWQMVHANGNHVRVWEAVALDERESPTGPPEFGLLLDGRPDDRIANAPEVIKEALRRERVSAIADYLERRGPADALNRQT